LTIREAVRANETKASLIRMEYKFFSETIGDISEVSQPRGNDERQATHMQCLWAQDGQRVHKTTSSYAEEELLHGWVYVINGEVHKEGRLPDLMWGRIDAIEKFNWVGVLPATMSFRPLRNEYLLSQLLVPAYASVHQDHASIDGRDTTVLKVKWPHPAGYYSLIWIDLERGMPLRMEHYHPDEEAGGDTRGTVVESIKLHQLPNGGWIPVQGVSSGTARIGARERKHTVRLVADVNSISIDRKDIPDSVFDIQFPPGAEVENGIIGAILPSSLRMDAMARAGVEEIMQEMLASRTEPQADSALSDESAPSGSDANEEVFVGGSERQRVLDAGQTAGAPEAPLIWISICVFVLVFGVTCIAYALRSKRK
jgi:hypothetical protein